MTALATIKACGSLAMDAMTFGLLSKAAERERLEQGLRITFPDDWEVLLCTMDRFDRAAVGKPSQFIKQMWARGVCAAEETMALHDMCPAAFRDTPLNRVIGRKSSEVLPLLADALP